MRAALALLVLGQIKVGDGGNGTNGAPGSGLIKKGQNQTKKSCGQHHGVEAIGQMG